MTSSGHEKNQVHYRRTSHVLTWLLLAALATGTSAAFLTVWRKGDEPLSQREQQQQRQNEHWQGGRSLQEVDVQASEEASEQLPHLVLVTPTYARPFQASYLTDLSHLLRMVPPPFTWLVVESGVKTQATASALEMSAGYCVPSDDDLTVSSDIGGIHDAASNNSAGRDGSSSSEGIGCNSLPYIHLGTGKEGEDQSQFRGVNQRNVALQYVEEKGLEGVMYFMDDDNTYTLQLFEEFRKIRRVGILPVGLLQSSHSSFRSHVSRPMVRCLEPRTANQEPAIDVSSNYSNYTSNYSSSGSISSSSNDTSSSSSSSSNDTSSSSSSSSNDGGNDSSPAVTSPSPKPRRVRPFDLCNHLSAGGSHDTSPRDDGGMGVNRGRRWEIVGWESFGHHFPLQRGEGKKRFLLDMAGFAVSTSVILERATANDPIRFRKTRKGNLESDFLEQFVASEDELEILADGCRDILVWHKHSEDKDWKNYPASWQLESAEMR